MVDTLLLKEIRSLPTLRPTPETNDAFSRLVRFCLTAKPEDVTLCVNEVTELQKLSAKAEKEMERYWAEKIITSTDPQKELLLFWYYENYIALTDSEYENILSIQKNLKTIVFAGGGPLPLTALLLSMRHGLKCIVLEKDEESYTIARKLVNVLGLDKSVTIQHVDAFDYKSYGEHDVIYVAALVGDTEASKHSIILSIYNKMRRDSLLLCRSSYGARTLLYPPLGSGILEHLKPIMEVKPANTIINSFVILQKT